MNFFFRVARGIQQVNNGRVLPLSGWTCDECGGDASTNLWLNLIDGHIGCGRANFDGSGGKGHALSHFNKTGYSIVVKLGTITANSNAGSEKLFNFIFLIFY